MIVEPAKEPNGPQAFLQVVGESRDADDRLLAQIEIVYVARLDEFVSVANAILRDRSVAQDAVQDAFASAVHNRRSFRPGDLEAWLWRIVVNAAIAARRKNERRRLELDDAPLYALAAPAADGASKGAVWQAIDELPERQKVALFLRYYADLDYDSIARALAVRPGTIAAALHAAHRTLRAKLGEESQ